MAEQKINLCAPIPADLHARVCREKDAAGKTLGQYITELLINYYENGGKITMENVRTLAIQIPEELFQKLKAHLDAESRRRGKKVSQKEFLLELIRQALEDADQE